MSLCCVKSNISPFLLNSKEIENKLILVAVSKKWYHHLSWTKASTNINHSESHKFEALWIPIQQFIWLYCILRSEELIRFDLFCLGGWEYSHFKRCLKFMFACFQLRPIHNATEKCKTKPLWSCTAKVKKIKKIFFSKRPPHINVYWHSKILNKMQMSQLQLFGVKIDSSRGVHVSHM